MRIDAEHIVNYKLNIVKKCIKDSIQNSNFKYYIKNYFKDVDPKYYILKLWKMQSNFRFLPESKYKDYCKDAMEFLTSGYGDCEDFTVFNASILQLLGIKYKIKVTNTLNKGYYSHILLIVFNKYNNKWLPFDGTYRIKGLGGEPKHYNYKLINV